MEPTKFMKHVRKLNSPVPLLCIIPTAILYLQQTLHMKESYETVLGKEGSEKVLENN